MDDDGVAIACDDAMSNELECAEVGEKDVDNGADEGGWTQYSRDDAICAETVFEQHLQIGPFNPKPSHMYH